MYGHDAQSPRRSNPLPIQLYRAAQVRELDRLAIQDRGIPGYTLMDRAGRAAFAALRRQWPEARRVVVLCGGGNNAGDGYVLARLAQQAGMDCHALHLVDPERLTGDALTACQDADAAGVPIQPFAAAPLKVAGVVVDAVFGTGLEREVVGPIRDAIDQVNALDAGRLAIDIPSGLHGDRGAVLGTAVLADLTVSFIGLKQGLFTGEGPACCGRIEFDDLGVPHDIYAAIDPSCLRYNGEDLPRLLPRRRRTAHKGASGHVLVVGGDLGMAGAARMAAEAAARCGAGLVSVATRAAHAGLQAAARPEIMFRGVETPAQLVPMLERATVVALGPGLGTSAWGEGLFDAVLGAGLPVVLDADGLNLLARRPARRDDWVLTPHPGEAARLLERDRGEIGDDRFRAAGELVARYGGTCILKGAGSLIAAEGVSTVVCGTGNPGMATGGSGDILTGVVAGLMAQGLHAPVAARAGTFLHGKAGDLAAAEGERGLLAMDLVPHLRALVNP